MATRSTVVLIRGVMMPCGSQLIRRISEMRPPIHSTRHIASTDDRLAHIGGTGITTNKLTCAIPSSNRERMPKPMDDRKAYLDRHAAELDVLYVLRVYESVMESIPEKANAVKFFRRVTTEIERLRKIEEAARALTVDFNPMFNSGEEFNIRLRKLYTSIIENKFAETETDG